VISVSFRDDWQALGSSCPTFYTPESLQQLAFSCGSRLLVISKERKA
jgi:hypothetical protein